MSGSSMAAKKGSLAPAASAAKSVKILGGSGLTIRANAQAILNQPLFDADAIKDAKVPQLNDHLETAKKYAKLWEQGSETEEAYQKQILNAFQNFITYNNKVKSFFGQLEMLASRGLQGHDAELFEKGLDFLKKEITDIKENLSKTKDVITKYKNDLQEDYTKFSTDVQKAKEFLGTLQATKQTLLFKTDGSFAADLDKEKIDPSLSNAFKANKHELLGSTILNTYERGKEWAISEVSYNKGKYKDFDGYTTQTVFVLDLNKAGQLEVYSGKQGAIADLQNRYKSDQSAMNRDLAMIAGGAVAAVVGILIVVVGALADIATAGGTTAVVGAGIVVAAGGVATAIYGGVDYKRKSDDAQSCLVHIAEDEYLLSVMPGVLQQVKNLMDSIEMAEGELANLLAGWQEMGNSVDAFANSVKEVNKDDGFWVGSELKDAELNWGSLAKLVDTTLFNFAHVKIFNIQKGQKLADAPAADEMVNENDLAKYHSDAEAKGLVDDRKAA